MAKDKGSENTMVSEAEDSAADSKKGNAAVTESRLEEDTESVDAERRYFLDMNWYRDNNRSFTMLTASRLCPSCQKKKIPKSETALLKTIKDCCSKKENFTTPTIPLLEMVFRLFISNSNKPLSLERIQEELQQWMSDSTDPRDVSINKLKRILDNDRYYGLRPVPTKEDGAKI